MAICDIHIKFRSNDQFAGCFENTGQVILPVAFLTDVDLLAGWLIHLPCPYVFDAERGRQVLVVRHPKPLEPENENGDRDISPDRLRDLGKITARSHSV